MEAKKYTCCFTGHRPSGLPWGEDERDPRCLLLKAELKRRIEKAYLRGWRHFICGMALGCDLYFCEAALELRDATYPDLKVEAAVPCPTQSQGWSAAHRKRYEGLLDRCDWETLVQHHYDSSCMMRRNRYMVDHSSLVISVYDGGTGGTRNTLAYAMAQRVETDIIDLADFS